MLGICHNAHPDINIDVSHVVYCDDRQTYLPPRDRNITLALAVADALGASTTLSRSVSFARYLYMGVSQCHQQQHLDSLERRNLRPSRGR